WLHAPMVEVDGTKMSKSLGNRVFVSDLVTTWDPMAVRLAVLDHSYRAPWAWHEGLLPVATDRLARWQAAGTGDAAVDAVRAAIDDDLDFPRAIESVDRAAAAGLGGPIGAVIYFVAGIVTLFLLPIEIQKLYEGDGQQSPVRATTAFWILALGIPWYWKCQDALNQFWASKGAPPAA